MRKFGRTLLVAVATASIALAGCSGGKGGTPSAKPSSVKPSTGTTGSAAAAPPSAAPGGTASGCVVGSWKTTGITTSLLAGDAKAQGKGGGGVTMTIGGDGLTVINFDGMTPVEFKLSISGNDLAGTYSYGGKASGTVKMPAAGVDSGTWEPTGKVDFGALTVTFDMTSPTQVRLADKLPIAQFLGTSTADSGATVDGTPILAGGTFKCAASQLTLTVGPTTWTFTKS